MKIKLLAAFLAIPAIVGILDAWLYVFAGRAVLVSWNVNNLFSAWMLAVCAWFAYMFADANR